MSDATSGIGAEFRVGDGATPTEAFTKVAEVQNISGPELTAEQIEVTSLDSVGGYKEYIPGLLDSGSVTLEMNFLAGDAQQTALRTKVMTVGQAATNFRIVLPDPATTTITFAGIVESYSPSVETGSQITASVTIKITGATVWS